MVQLIDWPTGPQLVAVTIRRGSTVSVTRSEERRVGEAGWVRWRVEVWSTSPAVTEEGRKVLTRLRRTSLVIVSDFVSVASWSPLSAVAALALLATFTAVLVGATW